MNKKIINLSIFFSVLLISMSVAHAEESPWTNDTENIYVKYGYPENVNITGDLKILGDGGNIFIVDASRGFVGIGTLVPTESLTVVGNASFGGNDLVVDSGNVGIGTTNPSSTLDVVGGINGESLTVTGTVSADNYTLSTACSNGQILKWENGYFICGTDNIGDSSAWNSTGTEIYPVDLSDKVGIGTNNPDGNATLHVVKGTSNAPNIDSRTVALFDRSVDGHAFISVLSNSIGNAGIHLGDNGDDNIGRIYYDNAVNALEFWTNNAQRMTVDSSGKVGIGTTTPSEELEVAGQIATDAGTSGSGNLHYELLNGTGSLRHAFGLKLAESGSNSGSNFALFSYDDTGSFLRTTLYAERATGELGIGTTDPKTGLDVEGGIRTRAGTENSSCSSSLAGTMMYNETSTAGTFFGCAKTGASSWAWVNLN